MLDSLFTEPKARLEKLQIAAVCMLMLLGIAFVYSATMVSESAINASWYNQMWVRQIFWYIVGTAVVTLIATSLLPDRSRADISVEYDAAPARSTETDVRRAG